MRGDSIAPMWPIRRYCEPESRHNRGVEGNYYDDDAREVRAAFLYHLWGREVERMDLVLAEFQALVLSFLEAVRYDEVGIHVLLFKSV